MINRLSAAAVIALGIMSACQSSTSSLPASFSESSQRRDFIAAEGDKVAVKFGAAIVYNETCKSSHGITMDVPKLKKQKPLFVDRMTKLGYTQEEIEWAFHRRGESGKRRVDLIEDYLTSQGADIKNDASICAAALRERQARTEVSRFLNYSS